MRLIFQEFLDAGNTLEKVNAPDWDGHYLVNRIDMTKEDVQRWVEDLLTNFEQCPKCGAFEVLELKLVLLVSDRVWCKLLNKSINFGVSSSKGRQTSPELVIINYKGENSDRCESS